MWTLIWKTCLIALLPMMFPAIMENGESFIAFFVLNLLNFNLISGQMIDGLEERGLKEICTAIPQTNIYRASIFFFFFATNSLSNAFFPSTQR